MSTCVLRSSHPTLSSFNHQYAFTSSGLPLSHTISAPSAQFPSSSASRVQESKKRKVDRRTEEAPIAPPPSPVKSRSSPSRRDIISGPSPTKLRELLFTKLNVTEEPEESSFISAAKIKISPTSTSPIRDKKVKRHTGAKSSRKSKPIEFKEEEEEEEEEEEQQVDEAAAGVSHLHLHL